MNHAEIRTVNGAVIIVEGSLSEVEKELSDAARSGRSRFAWLTDVGTGQQIGVNPDHVVSLRLSETDSATDSEQVAARSFPAPRPGA